jgi:ribosomal protein S18 acetylase RimI-like enzyme
MGIRLADATSVDREHLREHVVATWGTEAVVAHGEAMYPLDLPGFVALEGDRIAGHATFRMHDGRCELVSIVADPRRQGTGSRLLDAVVAAAQAAACASVWLTTTNDNVDAMQFYRRRGFVVAEVRRGAVDEARRTLKPEIPAVGESGIPIRDEIDLVRDL